MSKYHARRTQIDGIFFDSMGEASRYQELRLNEHAGQISNLRCHVKYALDVNRVRVGYYEADFVYVENGKEIVEDFKGVRTPVYRLKKKMMKAIYGIEIFETGG